MGKTISEKILARASNRESVSAGEIIWVEVDKAMMDDILGPRVEIADKLKELSATVKHPEKVVVISDHYTPPANEKQANIVKFTREWARDHGVKNYYEFAGPCHQVMAEFGYDVPGTVVLGTDSHTCMGGALGAFSTGIGSTEMLGVLISGKTWLRVPETIQIIWSGKLRDGVMAKDVSLATIGRIGHSGATYKTVEYQGETIANMEMDERLCLSNMAVEMGAKAGLIATDAKTRAYLHDHGCQAEYEEVFSDTGARYCETLNFDAASLVPQVSCPHEVDNVSAIETLSETIPINQAYIGSCTGGRLHDLEMAARLVKDKKVASGVRFLVSPASNRIWKEANEKGYLTTLANAGAVILAPTCGLCTGLHSGILGSGEVCISSTNRNFLGRMGSKDSFVYLASPLSVAAAAITGRVTDPRELI